MTPEEIVERLRELSDFVEPDTRGTCLWLAIAADIRALMEEVR